MRTQMTFEEIWTYIDANEPFIVFLSDGRRFLVKDHHWISSHPSRKGTSIRVYGSADDEEHYIPIFAITSIGENGWQ
jgi:hypothetical protein